MSKPEILQFTPPGPVAARFLNSDAVVSSIMGPIGSAKTSTCIWKIARIGQRQAPAADGVRYTKWRTIRETYRQLQDTTIPSWLSWFPKNLAGSTWRGGTGSDPSSHHLRFALQDGTEVDLINEFVGLGDRKIEDVMRGWEGTGVWLNEADRLVRDVLTYAQGRVGRYPSKNLGKPTWSGVICDFNAPDEENWCARDFIFDRKPGFEFFRQPSGLAPDAENLHNLPEGYYEKAALGQDEMYVRRMIKNELGFSRDGKPVYTNYNDDLHCAKTAFGPQKGIKIQLGADAGRTPAIVFGQRLPNGRLLKFDELVGFDMGATLIGEAFNKIMAEDYPDFEIGRAWCDPTAFYKHDTDEYSWVEKFFEVTGVRFEPAPSNVPSVRVDAVQSSFAKMIDGQPAVLISPKMKTYRKGCNSGYRYKRYYVEGRELYQDSPDKNEYSHVCDADQYLTLGGGEYQAQARKAEAMGRIGGSFQAQTDFNLFGGR